MQSYTWDSLRTLDGPWFFALPGTPDEISTLQEQLLETTRFAARLVQGDQCPDSRRFFEKVARAWEFPNYFGKNWDAFEECVNDLYWLEETSYAFLVSAADRLLFKQPDYRRVFIDVMLDAGSAWSTTVQNGGTRPFHTVLQSGLSPEQLIESFGLDESQVGLLRQ